MERPTRLTDAERTAKKKALIQKQEEFRKLPHEERVTIIKERTTAAKERRRAKEEPKKRALRKAEIIQSLSNYTKVAGIPRDEFENTIRLFIEEWIDEKDEGIIKEPNDIFEDETFWITLESEGIMLGVDVPEEEDFETHIDFEREFDEWSENFRDRANRLLGAIAFAIFQ